MPSSGIWYLVLGYISCCCIAGRETAGHFEPAGEIIGCPEICAARTAEHGCGQAWSDGTPWTPASRPGATARCHVNAGTAAALAGQMRDGRLRSDARRVPPSQASSSMAAVFVTSRPSWADARFAAQLRSLRTLYCGADGDPGHRDAVTKLAHSASFHSWKGSHHQILGPNI
jgi:hypothetical protein